MLYVKKLYYEKTDTIFLESESEREKAMEYGGVKIKKLFDVEYKRVRGGDVYFYYTEPERGYYLADCNKGIWGQFSLRDGGKKFYQHTLYDIERIIK